MFSRRKPTSRSLVKPGREGERERVAALEEQLQSLSTTAVKAVDRATELEEQVDRLKKELCTKNQQPGNSIPRRMPMSNSMSSIRSHNSDHSSGSFSSIFSDSTTLTHITSGGVDFPVGPIDGDLVHSLKNKLEESELQRRKLELALTEERSTRSSLESQVEELRNQLRDSNEALKKGTTATVSLSPNEPEKRLRTLEISIRAINSAREALNQPRLYKYI